LPNYTVTTINPVHIRTLLDFFENNNPNPNHNNTTTNKDNNDKVNDITFLQQPTRSTSQLLYIISSHLD